MSTQRVSLAMIPSKGGRMGTAVGEGDLWCGGTFILGGELGFIDRINPLDNLYPALLG